MSVSSLVSATSLPFQEAQDYFRAKVNVPTARWTDLKGAMHARAFTVAGAVKDELLSDFRSTIQRVVDGELTLEAFRKDFDRIVAAHGWSYKGSRGWRTKVIYETNLRTAHQAGRYKQMTDPDVLRYRPWWQYQHSDLVQHPREQHLAWDGKVWRHDDPVWDKIYPPNGWGCQCSVIALSDRQMKALGKDGPDPSPDLPTVTRTVNAAEGKVAVEVPAGVDPGWDYNVGEAAWGRAEQRRVIIDDPAQRWESLPGFAPPPAQPLPPIPVDDPVAPLRPMPPVGDEPALRDFVRELLGGDEGRMTDPLGTDVLLTQALADHVLEDPDKRWTARLSYWSLIPEIIADPAEIWIEFQRNAGTGRVGLVRRYVKLLRIGKTRTIPVVLTAQKGMWEGLTTFVGDASYVKNLRRGLMLYRRGDVV
ncbi:PBECR2 nuclease fold domain-containing protein [Niveispirillum sp. KHB5.9]|uniref:PBECR2 nuclease fold domain-containing protein n=1 Tax=Niveispirillum sp. KHB5.9 TaxID=3400269 RepID=UPI003A8481BF